LSSILHRGLESDHEDALGVEFFGELVSGEGLIFAFQRKRGTACTSSFQTEWK
jgi:hypothetical protein